jgi:hypothetical protein
MFDAGDSIGSRSRKRLVNSLQDAASSEAEEATATMPLCQQSGGCFR